MRKIKGLDEDGTAATPLVSHADQKTQSTIKVYSLVGLNIFLAFAIGYLFSVGSIGLGVLLLTALIPFLVIETIVVRDFIFQLGSALVSALGFVAFLFGDRPIQHLLAIFLVVFITLLWAHMTGQSESNNMVKLKFMRISRPVIGILLTGMIVYLGFIAAINGSIFLKTETISRTLDILVSPIARQYIVDFSSDMTVQELASTIALDQINKQIDPDMEISSYQKGLMLTEGTKAIMKDFEGKLGYKLNPSSTVGENASKFITDKIGGIEEKNKASVFMITIVLVVLTIKGIELLFYLPLSLLALLLYELLIAFRFIVVQFDTKSKEVVNLH